MRRKRGRESRALYVDEITSRKAKQFVRRIAELNELSKRPITLYIDSEGGEVIAGFDMYDVVKKSKAPVTGIVRRRVASMAVLVLQACKKRFMHENSHMMLHSISVTRSLDDLLDPARCVATLRGAIEKQMYIEYILKNRTKLSYSMIRAMMQRGSKGTTFTAAEAKTAGFIDEVL